MIAFKKGALEIYAEMFQLQRCSAIIEGNRTIFIDIILKSELD
jgi:hypothetical protein